MNEWEWPQYTILAMTAINLLLEAAFHGRPKTEKHNIFVRIIGTGISLWILISGGFFS